MSLSRAFLDDPHVGPDHYLSVSTKWTSPHGMKCHPISVLIVMNNFYPCVHDCILIVYSRFLGGRAVSHFPHYSWYLDLSLAFGSCSNSVFGMK